MRKLISTISALIAAAVCLFAQTTIEVQVPNIVGLNEQFNVTFVISGEKEPSNFSWSCSDDFQLVWGPQRGTMTTYSNVSGRSSRTTYTYTLMPKAIGSFHIPAADATVGGKVFTSNSPVVEVVAESQSSSSASSGSSGSSSSRSNGTSSTGTVSDNDLYITLVPSKRNVVVGESVTVTLKLYHRVSLVGFENVTFPRFNSCWSQETYAPSNLEFKRESVNGQLYNTSVLRTWNVVPQTAGELTIDPAELVCLVNVRIDRPSTGSIFDSFFQDDYQTIRKRLASKPMTLNVRNLPSGAPASFGGGVGNFAMSVNLTRDNLSVHDASSLEVRITGSGNTSLLEAPTINFPPDFEVYDVKSTDIPGGKLFEYPFIPRSYGEFTIPAVQYSYYDISSGRYVTLSSQPIHLDVARGNGSGSSDSTSGISLPGVQRRDVRDVGSDIRFVAAKFPALAPEGSFYVGSALFWVLWSVLLVLAVVLYFVFRSVAARRADVAGSKNRAAVKLARKRLVRAQDFLNKNLYTAFYEELHKALLGYASDKFNMDASDMSKENIAERFKESGASEAAVADFVALIDACEFARYAPDAGHEAMNAHYDSAVHTISSIEDSMKKSHKKPVSAAAGLVALLLMLVPFGATDVYAAEFDREQQETLWNEGVRAYSEGDWNGALQAWSEIRDNGEVAWELYYNMGNACFKNGDIAHAILYYERALKLDPSVSDVRFNLEMARSMIQDDIQTVPEFFLTRWMRGLCYCMSSDAWAVMGTVLFALMLALALLFLLGASRKARITGFVCGLVALALSIFSVSMAGWQKSDYRAADTAIVTRPVSTVRSSPADNTAKDLFVLHEGTKVDIIDELGSWYNIELSDGRQGWIPAGDLEII